MTRWPRARARYGEIFSRRGNVLKRELGTKPQAGRCASLVTNRRSPSWRASRSCTSNVASVSDAAPAGGSIHGLDVSEKAVAEAREIAARENLSLTYEVADLNFITLPRKPSILSW